MATNTLRADSAGVTSAPTEPSPDECPDVYASICVGDCLAPVYRDGDCLVFSKVAHAEKGDFVGIWLHPNEVSTGETQRRVKRLAMAMMPGLTFHFTLPPEARSSPSLCLKCPIR